MEKEAAKQFCPNCNSEMELDEDVYICPECGTEVQPEIDWEGGEDEVAEGPEAN